MAKQALIILLFILVSSCSEQADKPAQSKSPDEKITVQTVNYPLYYFADRLSDDHFDIQFLAPSGEDPAFWNPSDKDVLAFQQADIVVRNGAEYAKWIKTVSLPSRNSLDTSSAFSSDLIHEKGKVHQHGNGSAHQHGTIAFTVWLDFSLAEKQAQAIADRFMATSPASSDQIKQKLQKLTADLASLDNRMKAWSRQWGSKPLLVSHPVYQYWARRYHVTIRAVHWEPEMAWDSNREKELDAINQPTSPAGWMIWEGTPAPALVDKLKDKGIKSIIFSPCANRPPGENDWLSVMDKNISRLEAITP